MSLLSFEFRMSELWMELNALLASGDITDQQANEWADMKAEQWKGGAA